MGRAPVRDLYSVLDVQRDADVATIRKAFLAAALREHPDKAAAHKDAGFDAVSQAWQVHAQNTLLVQLGTL